MVAGSEAGWWISIPEEVIESGRLGPGQMLGVDMSEHKVYHNEEMLDVVRLARATYAALIEDGRRCAAVEPGRDSCESG